MNTAHARVVREVIRSGNAHERAVHFPTIARTFPDDLLKRYENQPPYYCHFMEWRLATLSNAQLHRLDALLTTAESIDGWQKESRSLVCSADFGMFWSLIWQLQVAEFLQDCGYSVSWLGKGPDLSATKQDEQVFVECLAVRKGFDVVLFIEDLLRALHPMLRIQHQLFLRRATPGGGDLDRFLGELVVQLDAPGVLAALVDQAATSYPVLVPLPSGSSNLSVYLEGADIEKYDPSVLPQGGGDLDAYLSLILKEAVSNKLEANLLSTYRPNALFVNFLLGVDQQLAVELGAPTIPDFHGVIDDLVWGRVGIDERLDHSSLHFSGEWRP